MPRAAKNVGTETGTGTTGTRRQYKKTGTTANRKNITTGLIQANQVSGLSNIADKNAQLAFDALLVVCNAAIASHSWEQMAPVDLLNVAVNTYNQMQHRT